jgi:tetratricopeptide (TPR) repeat protein
LAFSRKRRRDSTRILYEILLASKNGVSKTKAVHASNLNFRLIEDYLAFLLKMKYLERTPNGSSHDELRLTDKGTRLLSLLEQLENEIKPFRTFGIRREVGESKRGHEAKKSFAHAEAIRALKRARDLTSRDRTSSREHEYQISLALLQVYALQGQVSNELAEIERVLSLAQTLSDNSKLAEAHAWKSNYLTRVGNYQQAILEGEKALDFAKAANDESKVAGAQLAIGEAHVFLGRKDEPLQYFSAALKYYEGRGDRVGKANAARLIAQLYLNCSDFPGALDQANRALALFREVGDRMGEDETLRYLGDICCARGDYLHGLDYYEQVLKIRREIGNRSREGGALGDIGDVYLSLGQYEKSLDLHRQSLAIDIEVGYRFGEVWDHHDLGVIQFNLGNLTQAREELGQAIRCAKDINAPDLIILSDNDLSTVLRNISGSENLENALQSASEASKMGEDYALVSGRVIGESNMAMAYRAMGNGREALDHSERAVKLLEDCGQTEVQEEEIFFNHYLVLRDNKKPDEANDYLKRAFDKMMSKAGNIKDSVTREIFLKRVTINGSINSAWKEQAPVNSSGTA